MTVLGGQLDGTEVVGGVQPLREVGDSSLDRVDGSANEFGDEHGGRPDAAVCDGVAEGARERVGELFQEVGQGGDLYDLDDESWRTLLAELTSVEELPCRRDRRIMSDAQSRELLEALRYPDSDEARETA